MITRKASALATASSSNENNLLVFEDAPEFMDDHAVAHSLENVDSKVKAAQEQLLDLRRQQEEIERQKQHLEALRLKQERFVAGKRDLVEKIARSASLVERELYDAQKRVEELALTHDEFRRHLDILKSLQPEKWHRAQVSEELDNALAAIEDAENDYAKGIRRLHAMGPQEGVSAGTISLDDANATVMPAFGAHTDDLKTWLRRGFAFTLPLMGTVLVAIVLIRLMF
jgi:predicted RNase H-like nuclease (RuvC/YqgF family)